MAGWGDTFLSGFEFGVHTARQKPRYEKEQLELEHEQGKRAAEDAFARYYSGQPEPVKEPGLIDKLGQGVKSLFGGETESEAPRTPSMTPAPINAGRGVTIQPQPSVVDVPKATPSAANEPLGRAVQGVDMPVSPSSAKTGTAPTRPERTGDFWTDRLNFYRGDPRYAKYVPDIESQASQHYRDELAMLENKIKSEELPRLYELQKQMLREGKDTPSLQLQQQYLQARQSLQTTELRGYGTAFQALQLKPNDPVILKQLNESGFFGPGFDNIARADTVKNQDDGKDYMILYDANDQPALNKITGQPFVRPIEEIRAALKPYQIATKGKLVVAPDGSRYWTTDSSVQQLAGPTPRMKTTVQDGQLVRIDERTGETVVKELPMTQAQREKAASERTKAEALARKYPQQAAGGVSKQESDRVKEESRKAEFMVKQRYNIGQGNINEDVQREAAAKASHMLALIQKEGISATDAYDRVMEETPTLEGEGAPVAPAAGTKGRELLNRALE